jgi:hypothetical protein
MRLLNLSLMIVSFLSCSALFSLAQSFNDFSILLNNKKTKIAIDNLESSGLIPSYPANKENSKKIEDAYEAYKKRQENEKGYVGATTDYFIEVYISCAVGLALEKDTTTNRNTKTFLNELKKTFGMVTTIDGKNLNNLISAFEKELDESLSKDSKQVIQIDRLKKIAKNWLDEMRKFIEMFINEIGKTESLVFEPVSDGRIYSLGKNKIFKLDAVPEETPVYPDPKKLMPPLNLGFQRSGLGIPSPTPRTAARTTPPRSRPTPGGVTPRGAAAPSSSRGTPRSPGGAAQSGVSALTPRRTPPPTSGPSSGRTTPSQPSTRVTPQPRIGGATPSVTPRFGATPRGTTPPPTPRRK